MHIGYQIRKIRIEKNITQEQLSIGIINRSVLNRIEIGKTNPSIDQLLLIAKRLDTNVAHFFAPKNDYELNKSSHIDEHYLVKLWDTSEYQKIINLFLHNSEQLDFNHPLLFYYVGISYIQIDKANAGIIQLKKFIDKYDRFDKIKKHHYVIEYCHATNKVVKTLFYDKKTKSIEKLLLKAKMKLIDNNKENHEIFLSINQNLINYYLFVKEPVEAVKIGERLLCNDNIFIHKRVSAFMHQSVSVAYYDLGDFIKSQEHLESAILLYKYSKHDEHISACIINKSNIFRETINSEEAVNLIEKHLKGISFDSPSSHLLKMQLAIIYTGMHSFKNASTALSYVSYLKLHQSGRATYNFIKGILFFVMDEYEKALAKFDVCERLFEYNKFYFDLKVMNLIKYTITNNHTYLDQNNDYPYSKTTKNVFLQADIQIIKNF